MVREVSIIYWYAELARRNVNYELALVLASSRPRSHKNSGSSKIMLVELPAPVDNIKRRLRFFYGRTRFNTAAVIPEFRDHQPASFRPPSSAFLRCDPSCSSRNSPVQPPSSGFVQGTGQWSASIDGVSPDLPTTVGAERCYRRLRHGSGPSTSYRPAIAPLSTSD